MKKNDILLILILLLLSAAAYVGIRFYGGYSTDNAQALVTVDGTEYGRYPLSRDCTIKIKAGNKRYNVLVIQNGYADMREATCPDGVCVAHRKINKKGETLVCLPNKVVVEIINTDRAEVDSSTH
ncbi:MAG: NusG domain II-containing protein [Lachnospiraceae bacterium]